MNDLAAPELVAGAVDGDPSAPVAARLLVIVSGDYGELGGAMYFLNGLRLATPATVLLPASLRQSQSPIDGIAPRVYDSLDDIVRVVDELRPDIAMMFCGYLLTIGRRLTLLKAWRLRRLLRQRGIRVVTSDPFLGMLDSPKSLRFADILRGSSTGEAGLAVRLLARALSLRLYLMGRLFRHDLHIYPAPVDAMAPGRRLPYFNASRPKPATHAADGAWLFVLSQIDHQMQCKRWGVERFHELLAARLSDAAASGARVCLIGPAGVVKALTGRVPANVELDSAASYRDFMQRLSLARYAFFWNHYSFSIIHRVIARQVVFFFDEGHMVSILPSLRDTGIQTFYGGWTPPSLSMEQRLDSADLVSRETDTLAQFERITRRLESGLKPSELIEHVAS
ncbi:hypothetical protein [Piscinibacter terrae]|uniref:Uncharacterized protein n=1 Tax=Piscinibacter terrae TaxID=2496871 RepID=A0A3N7ITD5_9BURK|nr:hypothetical protein [Albitalea terrae]RQP22102.1 hypothetical protein DZC73_24140 [Albitalea terrae]